MEIPDTLKERLRKLIEKFIPQLQTNGVPSDELDGYVDEILEDFEREVWKYFSKELLRDFILTERDGKYYI